jgi:hypothetical protein
MQRASGGGMTIVKIWVTENNEIKVLYYWSSYGKFAKHFKEVMGK